MAMHRKKRKEKGRGVSPLVATTLLVGFTVSLVALTILWSRGYIEERAAKEEKMASTKLACERVLFTVTSVEYSGNTLNIELENKATQKIDNFLFRIVGDAGGDTVQLKREESISELGSTLISLGPSDFDASMIGNAQTVGLIPMLKAGKGTFVPCSAKTIEAKV